MVISFKGGVDDALWVQAHDEWLRLQAPKVNVVVWTPSKAPNAFTNVTIANYSNTTFSVLPMLDAIEEQLCGKRDAFWQPFTPPNVGPSRLPPEEHQLMEQVKDGLNRLALYLPKQVVEATKGRYGGECLWYAFFCDWHGSEDTSMCLPLSRHLAKSKLYVYQEDTMYYKVLLGHKRVETHEQLVTILKPATRRNPQPQPRVTKAKAKVTKVPQYERLHRMLCWANKGDPIQLVHAPEMDKKGNVITRPFTKADWSQEVDHVCANKWCVNACHMRWVAHADNLQHARHM